MLNKDSLELVQLPIEDAWTLPPEAYTHPGIYRTELEEIFRRDWQCVGRAEQVPDVGDYLSVEVGGQPLLVVRDKAGSLRAMSRVCAHRGMLLREDSGNANRFVCPYHKWTYELDGTLRSAPMMQEVNSFDASKCSLPAVQLEQWHGFLFVNLDPAAASLSSQVTHLEPLVENYEFANMRIVDTISFDSPWNWKILVENFMEAYHHIGTHLQSLESIYPARDSHIPDNHGEPWVWLTMPAKEDSEVATDTLPRLNKEQVTSAFAAAIYPTFLFIGSPTGGVWYEIDVTDFDHMHLNIHTLSPADHLEHMSAQQKRATTAIMQTIHEEDIGANLGVWQGLKSPFASQGRLSSFEKAIWQLNQLWLARITL